MARSFARALASSIKSRLSFSSAARAPPLAGVAESHMQKCALCRRHGEGSGWLASVHVAHAPASQNRIAKILRRRTLTISAGFRSNEDWRQLLHKRHRHVDEVQQLSGHRTEEQATHLAQSSGPHDDVRHGFLASQTIDRCRDGAPL
jgi:hypothetical protein